MITIAVLALLTGGMGAAYLVYSDAARSARFDEVPADKTPEKLIVESIMEPEVDVISESGKEPRQERAASRLPEGDLTLIKASLEQDETRYCYAHLTNAEKQVYAEILSCVRSFKEDVILSTVDPNTVERVFSCVLLDHPDIFYLTGYAITKYTRGDTIEDIAFAGKYTMDAKEAERNLRLVEEVADTCIINAPQGDEYDQVKYVYEWLIKRCDYVLDAENNQNILSVFRTTETVCQGYAKAAQYLLNRMGVFCILCEGEALGREAHVWNIVRVNGEYYYLDVTWGDASYTIHTNEEDGPVPPEINYEYMCVPYSEIVGTHEIRNTVTLPVCNSMTDNYYVHEGLYFEEVNSDRLSHAFGRAVGGGEPTVTIKCANATVYRDMLHYLIDREHIFDYLPGSGNVNYLTMDDRCYLLFYLE